MNPCNDDLCAENARCYVKNHQAECICEENFYGNGYVECVQMVQCTKNNDCISSQACVNGQCVAPKCNCGANSECSIINHEAKCSCPRGFVGNPRISCDPPSNPCEPNPCGKNALCEIDKGNPICYCPKNMTGNPFRNCIPEGKECSKNSCGPNSGCRILNRKTVCFCLPNYEGNPPYTQCEPPKNPCVPYPCGPNTQCSIENGFAKCSCLPNYIESPNTIRGCVESKDPCESNPCGHGAVCDSFKNPICSCPPNTKGNPFRECLAINPIRSLCSPGPCTVNAECYVINDEERCACKTGYTGDPYSKCNEIPKSVCEPNPCGPNAQCIVSPEGHSLCLCPNGLKGDPTSKEGCFSYECLTDADCSADKACFGTRCANPCQGACGFNTHCYVKDHHPGELISFFIINQKY
jgi:hypothetical protein